MELGDLGFEMLNHARLGCLRAWEGSGSGGIVDFLRENAMTVVPARSDPTLPWRRALITAGATCLALKDLRYRVGALQILRFRGSEPIVPQTLSPMNAASKACISLLLP